MKKQFYSKLTFITLSLLLSFQSHAMESLFSLFSCLSLKNDMPLHDAAREGDLKEVQSLLENRANDIEAKDEHGRTPLHWAAWNGHLEIVKFLVGSAQQIGSKILDEIVNAKDNYNWTPLYYAAGKGYLEIVKCLVDAAADIEAKNKDGETPLHKAADKDRLEVVKFLVGAGTNIEVVNKDGETALSYAAYWGHSEVIEYLIIMGVNPKKLTKELQQKFAEVIEQALEERKKLRDKAFEILSESNKLSDPIDLLKLIANLAYDPLVSPAV